MKEGLYERLVTEELRQAFARAGHLEAKLEDLNSGDSHARISRFLCDEIERILRQNSKTPSEQIAFANSLLRFLRDQTQTDSDTLVSPPQVLMGLHVGSAPPRPESPMALSTLLARPGHPDLGREFAREIGSADRVDALVSFVTWDGVRRLRNELAQLVERSGQFRLITTTYIGATDADAVCELARLNRERVKIRVSFDGRRTRLHAKAWLFHRASGFSTAYVGSANLSASALGTGLEWMMKATEADLRHVTELFRGAFDSLWEDPEEL